MAVLQNILKNLPKRLQKNIRKLSAFVLWIPIFVFLIGSTVSWLIYSNLHRREQDILRTQSTERFAEMTNQLDLLFANSILRIQSYEDYLGSRPRAYSQDARFISQSLQYTLFQRVAVCRNEGLDPKEKLPKMKYILKIDAKNSVLAQNLSSYIVTKPVLKAIKAMLKTNDYQQAVLHNYAEMQARISIILRSRTDRNIFFIFTGPLENIFSRVDLRAGETLDVIDLQSDASWTVRSEGGVKKVEPNPPGEKNGEPGSRRTLVATGLPQSGLKLNLKFNYEEHEEYISSAMVAGFAGWVITMIISYLFLVLVRQNSLVTRLVIEKTHDLEKAHHELQETLLGRSRFLGNISHEIRTPLNLILGMIDLCEEEDVDQKISRYLTSMRSSGNHLLSMIDDLLDLAKSESNTLQIQPKKISLNPFLEEVARMAGQDCLKKNLRFYTYFASDLPQSLIFDPSRLRQVLMNLLRNACKYTSEGWVSLKVTPLYKSDQKATLCFEVEDTGVGIPQDKIGKIFDAFFQIEGSYALSEGGVGLGLAIVKEIIRKMGGRMDVESVHKQGSKFKVVLDFEVGENASWVSQYKSSEETPKHVWFVSEDAKWLHSMSALSQMPQVDSRHMDFAQLGSSVTHADESTWIFIDATVGTKSCDFYKSYTGKAHLVLVGDKKKIEDAAGATLKGAVLDNVPILYTDVLTLLGFSTKTRRRKEASANEIGRVAADPGVQKWSLIVADDDLGNQELYRAYFSKTPWQVEYALNGQEALDLYLKAPVDLLLLDVRMPVLDGFQVVEKIRLLEEQNKTPNRPILLVTADALGSAAERARSLKNVSFLTKPIKKAQLFEAIHKILDSN